MNVYEEIDDSGRSVKCRKDHRCEWCNELIHKGENAIIRVYKWDGVLNNERQHFDCYEAMNESIDECYLDEGFRQGEQARGKSIGQMENEATQ